VLVPVVVAALAVLQDTMRELQVEVTKDRGNSREGRVARALHARQK